MRGRLNDPLPEELGGDLGALGREITRETAQIAEIVRVVGCYERPTTVAGVDKPVIGQQSQRLPDGHDTDPELAGQLALRGKRMAR